MSEYWVSHKKYYCRYCEIYIADDAPSKQQHENGMRHKGNKERFVRGLYKAGEKRKKDLEEEKRDMARIEQAAQAAFSADLGAGHAKLSSTGPTPSTSAAPPKPPQKPSNPYANYSTAASLGFTDPDAERIAAETERRRTQGVVGDWQMVPAESGPLSAVALETADSLELGNGDPSRKRESEVAVDLEDTRQFKLRKKTAGAGLGQIFDPGIIPIKLKKKKEEENSSLSTVEHTLALQHLPEQHATSGVPKWTKVQWKRAGEEDTVKEEPPDTGSVDHAEVENTELERLEDGYSISDGLGKDVPIVKVEETPTKVEVPLPDAPPNQPGGGSLFRKRKVVGGGGSRGRRQT